MYNPILVMLQTGSSVYVHKSKCKVFAVTYMNFNVCLSCSIDDFYEFLFSFFAVMMCAHSIPIETWLRPTALKKKNYRCGIGVKRYPPIFSK